MKWFKHEDTFNNPKIKLLKRKHKAVGYAVYFQILELIGGSIEKDNFSEWFYLPEEYSNDLSFLGDELGVNSEELESVLDTCFELNLLQHENGRIKCEQLRERADEYTEKILRQQSDNSGKKETKSVSTPQKSGQSRDSVGTKSGIRIEEEKNRKENNINIWDEEVATSSEELKDEDLPNGMSTLKAVLQEKYILPPKENSGITRPFQEKAFRIAKELNITLTPEYRARWLKIFKDEEEGKKGIWSTDRAYSYLKDYFPSKGRNYTNENKIKHFFWLIYNGNTTGSSP